ncbi:MAG: hypothetical protein AVDCRST_MAG20-1325, partial [uncultured Acidimicrobiales bacterium]
ARHERPDQRPSRPAEHQHREGPRRLGHRRGGDDRRPGLLPGDAEPGGGRGVRPGPHQGRGVEADRRAAGEDRPRFGGRPV